MQETLNEAMERIALEIARREYAGAKWTSNKQSIADSFQRRSFNDLAGALVDHSTGRCWALTRGPIDARFTYTNII